jgi:hypothetical protein
VIEIFVEYIFALVSFGILPHPIDVLLALFEEVVTPLF